ncbi:hypothetical protein ACEWY4_002094 [Coilia grayii]|uniref:Uncharacterized protein n=1 Tax=Coilia grayii TaxID=363190 RepID=A0ABD1KUT9_9TELE
MSKSGVPASFWWRSRHKPTFFLCSIQTTANKQQAANMTAEPNYRRTKPGKKTFQNNSANGVAGPTSQIPGLCQSADDTEPEQRTTGRRVGIFATDSDYVKLAKQGGHKGLLSHDDVEAEENNSSYRAPDWFNSGSRSPLSPSQTSSADSTSSHRGRRSPPKGTAQPLAAPFGTDDISPWDQDAGAFTAGKEKDKVGHVARQMENMTMNEPKEISKYKKISHDKKCAKEPVSMSKLLSFGYMEDEKKSGDDDASSMTSEQTSVIAPDDELE